MNEINASYVGLIMCRFGRTQNLVTKPPNILIDEFESILGALGHDGVIFNDLSGSSLKTSDFLFNLASR